MALRAVRQGRRAVVTDNYHRVQELVAAVTTTKAFTHRKPNEVAP